MLETSSIDIFILLAPIAMRGLVGRISDKQRRGDLLIVERAGDISCVGSRIRRHRTV